MLYSKLLVVWRCVMRSSGIMIPKSQEFINSESIKIFTGSEHVLIGISPFNSYFSDKRMTLIFSWAFKHFNNVNLFIPDKISAYTLQAVGYDEKKAQQKTKRQDRYLRHKAVRALMSLGFSEKESDAKIIYLSDVLNNQNYIEAYKLCVERYENDNEFYENCLSTSKWVLDGKVKNDNPITEESLRIASKYFLAELPLYINTPGILGVKESLFVYKDTPKFLHRIYADKSLMNPGQGYASVYFEGETDEEQHKSKSDNPQVVLDSIMEHAACCIYWKNREGVYMGCNSMEAEILGFQSPDEVIGKTDFDLSWKKISSILRESDQRVMKTGKPEQIMEYPILANGKQAIMLTTKAPLYDNNKKIVGIVGTSIDVTDSYRVNDLAREYERQQLDLQQHRQFKKMIYQISHDLLSPLVSLKYFEKSCEEVSSENMNILRTAIDSIDGILKAMLDHYRNDNFSESGTMKQNILVSPAISEIVTQKQAEYSHKHFVQGEDKHGNFAVITYTPSPDCYDLCIECDLYSFKRMLSNLINNAVESVDNKIAEVNIKLYKENKQVRIDVCDNGRGIPPVIAGQIMQKEKDASVTTKIGGYGLGISQIQNTVEQYNGRININSQAQSGTVFSVIFPACSIPNWITSKLFFRKNSVVIVVCAEDYVQKILKDSIGHPSIKLKFIPTISQAEDFIKNFDKTNSFYILIDYDGRGQDDRVSFILENKKQTIIISKHYMDKAMHMFAKQHGVKVLPKQILSYVLVKITD